MTCTVSSGAVLNFLFSFLSFQSTVCHMENRQRQAVEGLYWYVLGHESALRTQGVHPYQVSTCTHRHQAGETLSYEVLHYVG